MRIKKNSFILSKENMHTLEPLKGDGVNYSKTVFTRTRAGNGLPPTITLAEEIGRGANNRVYRGYFKDTTPVVVRIPRRKSDTERAGYATWEFRHTLLASRLGVAPTLYDSWYVRHAKNNQRAGLYMIQEYFPCDLMNAFDEFQEEVINCREQIENIIKSHLFKLSEAEMLCYDLKPSNIVIRMEDTIELRFIDFGREFCEHSASMSKEENQHRTPVTNVAKSIAKKYAGKNKFRDSDVYKHLLYSVMMIVLSAITTHTIYEHRSDLKANSQIRGQLHCTRNMACQLLDNTRGDFIKMIKEMLRQEDIKSLLRHYLGRRYSGTRRVLRLARGIERN
jgi:tRNA A-37 threonylcarbamoyl transferase component Bud32